MAGKALLFELIAKDGASPAFLRVAGAADKAAASTARATKGVEGATARMGAAGSKLTKGLTLPLLAVGAVSVAQAAKWQKSMTLIQTAGGETAAKAGLLSKGLMKLATETGTSLDQLGEGIYTIAKAGAQKWSATEQLLVMKAAAQGAKAENVDLGTATDALSTVMLDYHVSASKAVATENQLIRASGLAKTNFADFSRSLSNVMPIASALGIKQAEILGGLATMTQHGVSPQQASENMRNLLFNLAGQNNVASQAMQQLGINTVDLTKNLSSRGLTGTLAIVDKALAAHTKHGMVVVDVHKAAALATGSLNTMLGTMTGKLKAQSAGLISGKVGITDYTKYAKSLGGEAGASALQFKSLYLNAEGFSNQLKSGKGTLTTSTAQYAKLLGGMTGAGVAMQIGGKYAADNARNVREVGKAALQAGTDVLGWNKTQDTLAVKMDKAKASLQVMAVEIGTALIPAVSKIADKVGSAVHWFENLSSTDKKVLAWSAGILLALGPVLSIGARLALVGRGIGRATVGIGNAFARITGSATGMSTGVIRAVTGMTSALAGAGIGYAFGSLAKNSSNTTKAVAALGSAGVGAAVGFGMGGPLGAAIGGTIGGLTSLATSFHGSGDAAKRAAAVAQAAMAAEKQAVSDLVTALQADNDMLGANTRAQIANQLQRSGALTLARQNNISLKTLTDAALGNSKATDSITRSLFKASDGGTLLTSTQTELIGALAKVGITLNGAALQADQLAEANGTLNLAARSVRDQFTMYGKSLNATNKYGQENVAFIGAHVTALGKQYAAGKLTTRQYGEQLAGLRSQLVQYTKNAAGVDNLIGSLAKMPKSVITKLLADPKVAKSAIGDVLRALAKQPPVKNTKVTATDHASPTIGGIVDLLDQVNNKSVTVTVTARTVGNLQGTYNQQVPFAARHPARGGYITGPGSGTSDSIPAMISNGEYVINAKQTAKYLPLLAAINSGTRGFASGGLVVNGIRYATQRAANNARTRIDSGSMHDIVSGIAGLLAAVHNRLAGESDLSSAARSLRDAAGSAKISSSALSRFTRSWSALNTLGSQRDRVNARLGTPASTGTAYERLATAQQAYGDSKSAVRAAVTGTFDISTAGVNAQVYTDQAAPPVTAGSILTQLQKAAANAGRFASLLKKLGKEGLNRALLNQLALAGPTAMDQAKALAAATPKQIAQINSGYASLNTAGAAAGTYIADQMYGAGVRSAQGLVNGLLSQQKVLNAAIRHLGDSMVKQLKTTLRIHSPSQVMHELGSMTGEGYIRGVRSKIDGVQQASKHLAGAAVPGRAGPGATAGGGITFQVFGIEDPTTFVRVAGAKIAHRQQMLSRI